MPDAIEDLLDRIESDPVFRHRLETQPQSVLKELRLSADALALLDAMLDEQAAFESEVVGHASRTDQGTGDANASTALRHMNTDQRRNLQAAVRDMRP